jgi:NitT/TauT family transport system substrate-binding protein
MIAQVRTKRLRGARPVAALLLTAMVFTGLVACGSDGEDNKSSDGSSNEIRMSLAPGIASLGEYVADEQGFFKENGLQVTISNATDITQMPNVVGRQFEFATSVQPIAIAAAARGLPIVVTAGGQQSTDKAPSQLLIVGPKTGIKTAKDMNGKTVGVATVNGNIAVCTLAWMKANGGDPASVKFRQVAFANAADALKSGTVDAVVPLVPFTQASIKIGGISLGTPCKAVFDNDQGSFLISDRAWAKDNLPVIRKVQKSLEQANTWIAANVDAAKAILSKRSGIAAEALADVTLPDYNGQMPVESMEAWIRTLQEFDKLTGKAPKASDLVLDAG